jgi:hypothetical protein
MFHLYTHWLCQSTYKISASAVEIYHILVLMLVCQIFQLSLNFHKKCNISFNMTNIHLTIMHHKQRTWVNMPATSQVKRISISGDIQKRIIFFKLWCFLGQKMEVCWKILLYHNSFNMQSFQLYFHSCVATCMKRVHNDSRAWFWHFREDIVQLLFFSKSGKIVTSKMD